MRASHGGVAAAVLALSTQVLASAPAPARAAAPPRLLNIVHVKVKPNSAASYATLEAQIVRAYERAKVKLYWIALQSRRDPSDVLYLNTYDSKEAADRADGIYQEAMKKHPELLPLQQRLAAMTLSTTSTLTTRRDDVDRPPPDVDFDTMRRLRLTTIQVKPGHEGHFLEAIRTASTKDGMWFVYEANEASTYALITIKRTPLKRTDGPAVPRALQHSQDINTKAETRMYEVRPLMSHTPAPAVRPTAASQGG